MTNAPPSEDVNSARIMLSLLESVERDGGQSQRRLASDLGIALGLVNAYLRRCVKKGLVKVSGAPARRYIYYLTPQGFAEKSRLTIEYLSHSFGFFRQARSDCSDVFAQIAGRRASNIVLAGVSDLAEIAMLCAIERGLRVVAIVDERATATTFVGVPVARTFDGVIEAIEAVVITDLGAPRQAFEAAVSRFGPERVLAPALLGLRARRLVRDSQG